MIIIYDKVWRDQKGKKKSPPKQATLSAGNPGRQRAGDTNVPNEAMFAVTVFSQSPFPVPRALRRHLRAQTGCASDREKMASWEDGAIVLGLARRALPMEVKCVEIKLFVTELCLGSRGSEGSREPQRSMLVFGPACIVRCMDLFGSLARAWCNCNILGLPAFCLHRRWS